MFKVIENPEFTHDIDVFVPVSGGHEKQTFKTSFRVMSDKDQEGLDVSETPGLIDFMKKAVISMDDLIGPDEKPLSYNDKVHDQMLSLPYVRLALLRAYMTAVTKARVGN